MSIILYTKDQKQKIQPKYIEYSQLLTNEETEDEIQDQKKQNGSIKSLCNQETQTLKDSDDVKIKIESENKQVKIEEKVDEVNSSNNFGELFKKLEEGLKDQMQQKQYRITQLEKDGKKKQALKRKQSLEKIERLKNIQQKLFEHSQYNQQSMIFDQSKKFEEGLVQLGISDGNQLRYEVSKKKQEILELKSKSLQSKQLLIGLENLLIIFEDLQKYKTGQIQTIIKEQIKIINEPQDNIGQQQINGEQVDSSEKVQNFFEKKEEIQLTNENRQVELQKKLSEGLKIVDLIDSNQINYEIIKKREQIKDLERLKKSNSVNKRKQSLEQLENLQVIYQEIQKNQESTDIQNKNIELKKELENGLNDLDLKDSELILEIAKKRMEVQQLQSEKKFNLASKRKKSLKSLENLQKIKEEIYGKTENQDESRIEDLQKILQEGLLEFDLENDTCLDGEISKKKEQIKELKRFGKSKQVQLRKKSLENLTNLQRISEEIRNNVRSEQQKTITELQKQLDIGLYNKDIIDYNDLLSQISIKQEEIKALEKQGFAKKTVLRKQSLENLQNLQRMHEQIAQFQEKENQIKIQELQKKLNEGLKDVEVEDGSQLLEEISRKKEEIQQLQNQRKSKKALQRMNSLEKLVNLQNIYSSLQLGNSQIKQKELELTESENTILELTDFNQPKEENEVDERNQQTNDTVSESEDKEEIQKIIKAQIDLQQDIENTSCCSEKYLMLLLNDSYSLMQNIQNDQLNEQELTKQLQTLQKQLQCEDLINQDVKIQLSNIYQQIKSNDWKNTAKYTEKLLKTLRPLNIAELKRLIQKTEDATELIQEQDIILLLGGTGSGKSTTIHFLAGSPMKQLEVQMQGGQRLSYIGPDPTQIKNKNLQNILVSPYAKSETRYIQPVKVNFEDIGMLKQGSVILCDTPGFGDTAGPEVDIANGIGMINAIKGCKSVKPVILLSNQSIGDRGEGIRTLASQLIRLVNKVEEFLYSFSYLFTKFDNMSNQDISAVLTNILNSLNKNSKEYSDQQLVSLIEDMVEKAESQKGGLKLEPLNQNPSIYLKNLINKYPIQNPKEVFQVSIAEKSKAVLFDQVSIYKQSIISAIKRKDYTLIKQKLDDILFLIKILNLSQLRQVYDESVSIVKDNLNQTQKEVTQRFNNILLNDNKLTEHDIKDYQRCIEQFQEIQELRQDHLQSQAAEPGFFIQNISQIIEESNTELNIQKIKEDIISVRNKLDNLKLLAESFTSLETIYQAACKQLQQIQAKIVNEAKQAVIHEDYKKLSEKLSDLKRQSFQLSSHCSVDQLQVQQDSLIKFLTENLKEISENVNPILKEPDFNLECKNKINEIIGRIHKAKDTYELREYIKVEEVEKIIKDLNHRIFLKFENLCSEINNILINEVQNPFKNIEVLIKQMVLIKDIKNKSGEFQQLFYQTISKIFGKMKQMAKDAEMLLCISNQQSQNINYKRIFQIVNELKSAEWMESFHQGSYSEMIKNISEDLIGHALKLSELLLDIDLDLSNYNNLQLAWSYLSQFQQMNIFEEISEFSNLTKIREGAQNRYESQVQNVFDYIQKTFNLNMEYLKTQKEQLQKLKNLQNEENQLQSIQMYFQSNNIKDLESLLKDIEIISLEIETLEKDEDNQQQQNFINNQNENQITKDDDKNNQKILLKREQLQQLKNILDGYNNLLKTQELQNERDNILKKHEFSSYTALQQKEIQDIETSILTKESSDQDNIFEKFDGEIAEDSLNYLEACIKIRQIKKQGNQIYSLLDQFFRKLEANINHLLVKNYQKVINSTNNEINQAFKHAHQLSSGLQKILDLEHNSKVFQKIKGKEILSQWKKTLSTQLFQMQDQMQLALNNNQDIRNNLDISNALIQVDFILAPSSNFYSLYKQFKQQTTDNLKDKFKTIINLIEKCDFQQISSQLIEIEDKSLHEKALEQIKHNINIKIIEIIERAKQKSIALMFNSDLNKQIDQIQNIIDGFNKIENAKKYVPQFLDRSDTDLGSENIKQSFTVQFKIDFDLLKIQNIILNKVNIYIQSIMAQMNANNFNEAEEKIESLNQILQILGGFFIDDELSVRVKKLQESNEKILDEVIDQYINMDIEDYLLNPPKLILDKLQKVGNQNIRYSSSFNRIKESIYTRIREYLLSIKRSSIVDAEQLIFKIDQAQHFLPDDMKNYVDGELFKIKNKFKKEKLKQSKENSQKNQKYKLEKDKQERSINQKPDNQDENQKINIESVNDDQQIKVLQLQKQLQQGLQKIELDDGSELESEILSKKKEIKAHERNKRSRQEKERKKSLEKLENLKSIHEEIEIFFQGGAQNKLDMLQKQLVYGLEEMELTSGSQLEGEISNKKDQIKQLENQKRTKLAEARKKSLLKLENLQKICLELANYQVSDKGITISELKKSLDQGLEEFDLKSGTQLAEEISQKRDQIKQLEDERRGVKAQMRKKSLEKLEKLQKIFIQYKEQQKSVEEAFVSHPYQNDNASKSLINQLNQKIKQVDQMLKNKIDLESQDKIKNIIQEFILVKENTEEESIQEIFNNLNKMIFERFNQLYQEVNEILQNNSQNTFKDIKERIIQIKLIKDISCNQENITEKFNQITQSIFAKLMQIRRDTEILLSTFYHSPETVSYEKISLCVKQLMDASQIDNCSQDLFNDIMKHIYEDLTKHSLKLYEQISEIDLDISNNKNLEEGWEYLSQMYTISPFEQIINQLKIYRENAEKKFKNSASEVFLLIQKTFNLDSNSVQDKKNKLQKLKDIVQEQNQPSSLQDYLKKNNINNFNEFQNSIDKLEQDLNNNKQNIKSFEVSLDSNYEQQLQELQFGYDGFYQLEEQLQQNNNKKIKKNLKTKQKNILSSLKCLTIDDLKLKIEQLKEIINLLPLKQQLVEQETKLKQQKSIIQGYQKLVESEELKTQREESLKKGSIKNIRDLQEEIEKIEQELKNSENTDKDNIFEKLDGYFAEQSLHYLESSKKIKILKDFANKAEENLFHFLKNYKNQIAQELNIKFSLIKNLSQSDIQEVFKVAQLFTSRLQEIINLKPYSKVFQMIKGKEILIKQHNSLSIYLVELHEQMSYCIANSQSISLYLDIAKALTQIDFFVNQESNYFQLYKQYQSIQVTKLRNLLAKVFNLIEKCEFQQVFVELLHFDHLQINEKTLEQIMYNLNNQVTEIINNMKRKSSSINFNGDSFILQESITTLAENINKIQTAKRLAFKFQQKQQSINDAKSENKKLDEESINVYLIFENLISQIDQDLALIQITIENKIQKSIDYIVLLIDANDYDQVESIRENILLINQILGKKYLNEMIQSKLDDLQEKIDLNIEKVVKEYIDLNYEFYFIKSPKVILEKLKQVICRNIKYASSFNEIKEKIFQKIRQQLQLITNSQQSHRKDLIQNIKQIFNYIPDDIKIFLEEELKQFIGDQKNED